MRPRRVSQLATLLVGRVLAGAASLQQAPLPPFAKLAGSREAGPKHFRYASLPGETEAGRRRPIRGSRQQLADHARRWARAERHCRQAPEPSATEGRPGQRGRRGGGDAGGPHRQIAQRHMVALAAPQADESGHAVEASKEFVHRLRRLEEGDGGDIDI